MKGSADIGRFELRGGASIWQTLDSVPRWEQSHNLDK